MSHSLHGRYYSTGNGTGCHSVTDGLVPTFLEDRGHRRCAVAVLDVVAQKQEGRWCVFLIHSLSNKGVEIAEHRAHTVHDLDPARLYRQTDGQFTAPVRVRT